MSKKIEQEKATLQNHEDFSTVTLYLGNCYFKLKNYDKAISFYQKDPGSDKKQSGQRMNNLGTCYAMK